MSALNASTRNSSTSSIKGIDNKTWYTGRSKPILLTTDLGGNDVSGTSTPNTQTVIDRDIVWVTARKASNTYRNIIIAACEIGVNADYTANGILVNAALRTQMLPGGTLKLAGADDYVELANNPNGRYDSNLDYNDTLYFQGDKTHLTAAGYADAAAQCYITLLPFIQAAMAA